MVVLFFKSFFIGELDKDTFELLTLSIFLTGFFVGEFYFVRSLYCLTTDFTYWVIGCDLITYLTTWFYVEDAPLPILIINFIFYKYLLNIKWMIVKWIVLWFYKNINNNKDVKL